jgi:hypothetical protein
VSPLEKNRQRASELLARLSQPRGLDLHLIPQHRLLGVWMKVNLLVYPRCARHRQPVRHRIAIQVVLEPVRSYVSGTISGTSPCR